jgi:tRNA threonylcarbamoyladenosine biosynthesis protein TsaE
VTITRELPDPDDTRTLGREIGAALFRGAVVALIGPLGAGKTQLVRAIAEGLGLTDSRAVTSPTFVLLQEYPARLTIYHFDAYRLPGPAAFADLGVEEMLQGDGVCLIEWADRVDPCLPPDHLRITLEVTGESSRRATLEATGPDHARILSRLTGPSP